MGKRCSHTAITDVVRHEMRVREADQEPWREIEESRVQGEEKTIKSNSREPGSFILWRGEEWREERERLWSEVSDGEEAREVLTENPGHQMDRDGKEKKKRFETQIKKQRFRLREEQRETEA